MHKATGKATVKITLAILFSGIALGVSGQTTGTGTSTGASTGTTTTITTSTTSASLDDQSAAMNNLAASKGQTQVANKIAASFAILAGSKENSLALVNGLRNGNVITLTSVPPTGTTTAPPKTAGTGTTGATGTTVGLSTTSTSTTITPPTGKMGWGNVFISLALAQKVLTQAGITNPTAAQLNIALNGGELTGADGKTTTVKGVLQLTRADGMGWGKIAQVYGTKVGTVVSEIKAANRQLAKAPTIELNDAGKRSTAHRPDNADKSPLARTKTVSTSGTASTTSATAKSGVITANGTKAGNVGTTGITTAKGNIPSGKGSGIVTAAGGAGSSLAAPSVRNTATGLVTATGAASTSAAIGLATAQGNSGHGNGNSNGGKGKGG